MLFALISQIPNANTEENGSEEKVKQKMAQNKEKNPNQENASFAIQGSLFNEKIISDIKFMQTVGFCIVASYGVHFNWNVVLYTYVCLRIGFDMASGVIVYENVICYI